MEAPSSLRLPIPFAGFLIGRPTNEPASAELLAGLAISTVDKDGNVVETGCNNLGNATCTETLTLDLLGSFLIPGVTEGLVASR